MKIKFKAFSYIELLFGMTIVCLIFISAVPFLTRKAATGNATSGEFQCYTAFNGSEYRLYERLKRGDNEFSAPIDVTENGCKFFRPKNVNTYTLQVIGGGGGGSAAKRTGVGSYSNVILEKAVDGESGQNITVQTSLGGVWDENGVLTIHKCQNAGEDVPQSDPYREEYYYCVGDGGVTRDAVSGIGKVGGHGVKEMEYWSLLGVYHDLLFNSKTNANSILYAGRGNGSVSADDDLAKVRSSLGEDHSVYINLNNYLNSNSTDIQSLREAAGQLLTVIKTWKFKTTDSEGGAGGYSRFVLKDVSDVNCVRGNCLAKGGDGGTGNSSFNCLTIMAEDSDYCSLNEATCSCSGGGSLADMTTCSGTINCNAVPTNILGGGGKAGGVLYRYANRKHSTYLGNGGAGGGGAIIIKW